VPVCAETTVAQRVGLKTDKICVVAGDLIAHARALQTVARERLRPRNKVGVPFTSTNNVNINNIHFSHMKEMVGVRVL